MRQGQAGLEGLPASTVTLQVPPPGSEARGFLAQGLLWVDSQGDPGSHSSGTGPAGNGSGVLAHSLVALPLV